MSVNTAHTTDNGVLLYSGEAILLFSENVTVEFSGQDNNLFKGSKQGKIYLTTHRLIFNNKNAKDSMISFSFPFIAMYEVEIEQPAFSSNYIKGKIRAQPNGNWIGEAKFKLYFKSGGAIDFGQTMLRAARLAQQNSGPSGAPPPYTPPSGPWYAAPPTAYQPNPQGYYGWIPNTQAFPTGPPPDTVFMSDNPPPYPGIVPPGGPGITPNGQPGFAPAYNGGFQGYTGGYGQPAPTAPYGNMPPSTGYPSYPSNMSGPSSGYPNSNVAAMGFSSGPQPNSKEAEAAQSAYYDPNQPQTAYVPPPAYYEPPPSYNSLNNKKSN